LDLLGRQFTWSNNLQIPTFEKLDRILVRTEWELQFPKTTIQALTIEIKEAVFQIKNTAALRPDGFPQVFYQTFWNVTKRDLMALFEDFHRDLTSTFSIVILLQKYSEAKQIQHIGQSVC
jgi:hypothetical protein